MDESVTSFIIELARLSLIVPADMAADPTTAMDAPESAEFQPPMLESYNDMQDLLLLDLIHAVDEIGWPQKAPDAQANRT